MVELKHAAMLLAAGTCAGALNAVAGGGSFIAFPTMMFTGVPPIMANASNTVSLWPGSVASAAAYRKELEQANHKLLYTLTGVSIAGGLLGAWLLLHTPERTFVKLIPWLLLVATVLFTFGAKISQMLRLHSFSGTVSNSRLAGASAWQFLVAIYGGYFGAGIGILMLALLALMNLGNIHTQNAYKTVLGSFINGVAVITFIFADVVVWSKTLIMLSGAVAGGYFGAWWAQKIDPKKVRWFVISVGFGMTAYFFWKNG